MKVKNFLFVTFSLASASLGLALPSSVSPPVPAPIANNTKTPSFPGPADPAVTGTGSTGSTAVPASESAAISQIQAVILGSGGGGGGSGQLPSQKCAAGLLKIVTSPEFIKCLPPSSLMPLLPLVVDPTILQNFLKDPAGTYQKTIEQPLIATATGVCAAPKCSKEGVDGAIQIIQSECDAELKSNPPNPFIQAIYEGAVFYSPIRDILCFKDSKQFCFDQTMLTVIKLTPSPIKITGNPVLDSVAVADPSAICTKCDKDIVNTVFNFIKEAVKNKDQLVLDMLKQLGLDDKAIDAATVFVAVKCGIKFEDGTTP